MWWTKLFSHALQMDVAVCHRTGDVMTEDKVIYYSEELDALEVSGGIDKQAHLVKKVFCGEFIEPETGKEEWMKELKAVHSRL